MPTTVLPFTAVLKGDAAVPTGPGELDSFQMLPLQLRQAAEVNPHLKAYLKMIPLSKVGIPAYYEKLSREMGDRKEPNIIYPISDNLFVHILVDSKDSRNCYIPIEPSLSIDVVSKVDRIEQACIEFADTLPEFDTDGDREKQLMGYIDRVTTECGHTEVVLIEADPQVQGTKKKRQLVKIPLTPAELKVVKYLFIRDKVGIGELEPLAHDGYIEDISCAGLGSLFLEHKIFRSLKCSINFTTMDELDHFVLRMAEKMQKPLSYSDPIADATLPSGSRINIVYGHEVSKRGSNFTIRHFSKVPISIFELVDYGTLNYEMLAYLSLVIANGMNLFVSGESASGKTAMLNAITAFIHPLAKIITIEDTPELQVPHDNWIREVVQTTKAKDTTGAVTTFDLLKAALRQRPNEILVGEIRGPEGNVAFQAMQTGHSVMTTFHASTVEKLIQRITSNPISVPKSYIDNLNVVILMNVAKLPDGRIVRRITSISEIVGFDTLTDSFNIVEAFRWDEETDTHHFTGRMASYILEHKISPRLGIPSNKKYKVYAEIDKRAKIFKSLHKDQKITGFYEILGVLGKAQREGLF
jgi:archaeal flagellar protein FlaI